MLDSAKRLKLVMEHCHILNKEMARELKVDSSQVSRWINGDRPLRLSSAYLDAIAVFLHNSCKQMDGLEWLRYQLQLDGIDAGECTEDEIRENLSVWLACDGKSTMEKIGTSILRAGTKDVSPERSIEHKEGKYEDVCFVRHGIVHIVNWLEHALHAVPEKGQIDILLSNENSPFLTEPAVIQRFIRAICDKKLHIRLLMYISANTAALSNLITSYLSVIAISHMELFVIHGADQSVLCQSTLLIPGQCVASVAELPGVSSRPTLTVNKDIAFLQGAMSNFDRVAHYAQPLFKSFSDSNTRSIMEILISEYVEEGTLDVLKNGLNPMYMTLDGYNEMLVKKGYKGNALDWRSEEYRTAKIMFEENLRKGTLFREILSAQKLEAIVNSQSCCLPNVYLMGSGIVTIDAASCKAILTGYVDYLLRFPSFHLFIMDRIPVLSDNSCWHIKQNRHIAISAWDTEAPTLMYSDQLILTYDYQRQFNEYWMQSDCSQGQREKTITLLEQYALRLR